MTREEFNKRCEEMNRIVIHEAVEVERVGAFQPPLSRHYDRGVATLKDGRKIEFAWGLDCNLSKESVAAIHALQPEREFIKYAKCYYPALLESEK